MKKFDFSAEELSELEALQVRGGATGNPDSPMGQNKCSNTKLGCGAGVDQDGCTNSETGCGSIVNLACTIQGATVCSLPVDPKL